VLQIKVGQEIDGKRLDKITIDEDRDMTFWFNVNPETGFPELGLEKKSNESIAKILDYKWGEEDADKTKT
tara:strand:- start:426 stop:635 length:210 start_codon:yes stop_codon:yes gene_type:complete